MKRYEQIPHTADLAAKVFGGSLEELFENAAYALFDMAFDLEGVVPDVVLEVKVGGADTGDLLITWLNELLYRSFSEEMIFTKFKIGDFNDNSLSASVKGVKICAERIKAEIKAATYHDLSINKTDKGYEVTVVFDV